MQCSGESDVSHCVTLVGGLQRRQSQCIELMQMTAQLSSCGKDLLLSVGIEALCRRVVIAVMIAAYVSS